MAQSLAVSELKQIRAILGKLLKATEARVLTDGKTILFPTRVPRRRTSAKNVSRLAWAALEHLELGHDAVARALLHQLINEEGERR